VIRDGLDRPRSGRALVFQARQRPPAAEVPVSSTRSLQRYSRTAHCLRGARQRLHQRNRDRAAATNHPKKTVERGSGRVLARSIWAAAGQLLKRRRPMAGGLAGAARRALPPMSRRFTQPEYAASRCWPAVADTSERQPVKSWRCNSLSARRWCPDPGFSNAPEAEKNL